MKRIVLVVTTVALLIFSTACQSNTIIGGADEPTDIIVTKPTQTPTATPTVTPTPVPDNNEFDLDIEYKDNSLYALKYLGFELETISYNTELVSLPGDEYYLVIPRYDDMKINIYENTLADTDEYKEEKFLRFSSNNADPIVLKGNQSDIFANITVELIYNNETTEFSPYISNKDGSVCTTDDKGVIIE